MNLIKRLKNKLLNALEYCWICDSMIDADGYCPKCDKKHSNK